jgi:hypothetical protein
MPRRSSSRAIRAKVLVPIYDVWLHIVVDEDIKKARAEYNDTFGAKDEGNYRALCCDDDEGSFGVFFPPESLTRGIIAHEVEHLKNGILAYVGSTFDAKNDEHAAYLAGYLAELVYEHAMGEK